MDLIWAFKLKQFPDDLTKQHKTGFGARGHYLLEGIDFSETYAPVVQRTTIRRMLILETLLKLKAKQGHVTAAFLHADFGEDEQGLH